MRLVAQVRRLGQHVAAEAPEEGQGLGADGAEDRFDPAAALLLDLRRSGLPEQVAVQAAAQPAVRGDDDVADPLALALHGHEGVPILGGGAARWLITWSIFSA